MKDVLLDTLLDSAKLVPFLFFAFLIIEWLERKLNKKTEKAISKSGKLGPIFGSALGIIPQCGFGVVATNLYITRIISLGTLFSVYLSTSDEMLPVLLSEKAPIDLIIKILAIKFVVGIIYGFIIDFILTGFSWYYCCVFCALYSNTAKFWLVSLSISLCRRLISTKAFIIINFHQILILIPYYFVLNQEDLKVSLLIL